MNSLDPSQPLLFTSNRVWRCYTGGRLIDELKGSKAPADSHFPEEWLASTTRAMNGIHRQGPDEGLSRVKNTDGSPGALFAQIRPDKPGVLCKFLDSAVRLPIQCHPDRLFARKHYKSEHGKEESWFILGTRKIDGEEPYILAGFKIGSTKKAFTGAVMRQDIKVMESMLHKIPVKPGNSFFIPGRFPHAIGPGVFMLEVQEPTDWVVQPVRYIGDTELSESEMWGPLDPETALECFDYDSGASLKETLKRIRLITEIKESPKTELLVGPERTDSFTVERLNMVGTVDLPCRHPWHIAVVTAGFGTLLAERFKVTVRQGDCVFIPEGIKTVGYGSSGGMTVYLVGG